MKHKLKAVIGVLLIAMMAAIFVLFAFKLWDKFL